VRTDQRIDFDWLDGSPAPGVIGLDQFSIRWTQTFDLPAGNYQFKMTVDDGGRLWVDGRLLLDAWYVQGAEPYTADIFLTGGKTLIQMEYFENSGWAAARLSWGQTDRVPATGTVIVDDTDPGFVMGGSTDSWQSELSGYHDHFYWSWNSDAARPEYNWARWYANLAPGRYDVHVYIPENRATTTNARYYIAHADGYTLRSVDQSANAGRWVLLGTFEFSSGQIGYVSLDDMTLESRLSRQVAFDAVRWVQSSSSE
jgi:hypothetical protein